MRKLYRALCLYIAMRISDKYSGASHENEIIAQAAKFEVWVQEGITGYRKRFSQCP